MFLNHNPSRTWILAMTELALYLDDGGHPDDQPYLVVAGYVATEAQWIAFESAWRQILNRFKLGSEFHMTDFMRDRYTTLKRDQILGELALTTKRHTLRPFVCAIDIAAWKRVNSEFALEECHGAPFAIAARGLQKELRFWEAENLGAGDRMLVFVEEGTKHYGQMEQIFKRDKIPLPARVPKSMPQVQPSDILAWEMFNWLKNGSPRHAGRNLDRLTRPIRKQQGFGAIFYETDLRSLCRDSNVLLRASLRPGDTIVFHSEKKRLRKRTIK